MTTKIPSHVARELRRHVVKPNQKMLEMEQSSKKTTLAGVLGFLGFSMSIPAICMWWVGSLNDKEEPLNSAAVRRGAFLNSGSRDAGIDPKWDFTTGTYKKDQAYHDIFQQDNPTKVELGDSLQKQ